jgi:alkylhydroperoxidase family enzyme
MKRFRFDIVALVLGVLAPAWAFGDTPASDVPPAVPVTRADLLQALERSKRNEPRLPLPPISDDDKARAGKGEWGVVNNGRMRKHYLPAELTGAGFLREPDAAMTLGHPFQTMIFWIVSRGNNCTYCMGHQESKLATAGVADDRIAALDGDWVSFTPAERAAFTLAKKATFEPHALTAADLDRVRPYYNDKQILEILLVTGNFNAMNRWTGALRIPQEAHRVYVPEGGIGPKASVGASRVAPLGLELASASATSPLESRRPPLESRAEVESALAACRTRTPRLPLADETASRAVLPSGWTPKVVPQWVRLLANFPKAGAARVALHKAAEDKGKLDPRLRAQVAWIAARNDRAWYAVGEARRRLRDLGQTDDQVFALDGSWDAFTPADRAAFALSKTLTTDPALVTDAAVAAVRKHFSDYQTAEIIHHVTEAAFFDRVTEAAGLRCEK